ncbi:MAG: phage head closure protein [Rhizobiales bacterium]|nr:phage head closure protein [Hyphomicrobiales bacterium]
MRAGRLDRKITIQRKTVTQSSSGAPIETWAAISHRRWASYRPVRGDERFGGEQWAASEQVEFSIRYSSDVADLSPLDRVIYPAPDVDTPTPADNTIFDIMAVQEIGRREGLRLVAARRAERPAS